MYSLEPATLEEYIELCHHCIEQGEVVFDDPDGCEFVKLTYNGEPLIITNTYTVDFIEGDHRYISAAVSPKVKKHLKQLLSVGREFMNGFTVPVYASIEKDGKIFEAFAEKFGFKKTDMVESTTGVEYNIYVRY